MRNLNFCVQSLTKTCAFTTLRSTTNARPLPVAPPSLSSRPARLRARAPRRLSLSALCVFGSARRTVSSSCARSLRTSPHIYGQFTSGPLFGWSLSPSSRSPIVVAYPRKVISLLLKILIKIITNLNIHVNPFNLVVHYYCQKLILAKVNVNYKQCSLCYYNIKYYKYIS